MLAFEDEKPMPISTTCRELGHMSYISSFPSTRYLEMMRIS